MRKKNGQRGVISVFLAIVLVPCIVFTSMFVDLSRVNLSHGVAVSAADLALNSLLTNFDADLSDIYGMMASCQNIDEFYSVSEDLFRSAISSSMLSDDDMDSMIAVMNSIVQGGDINDMLLMNVETESEDEQIINKVKGGSVGESSVIIKDQIVEFMKYRGPVEILTGIIEKINNSTSTQELIDSEKNEEITDAQQSKSKAESDLLEKAYYTYLKIKEYEDLYKDKLNISEVLNSFSKYKNLYKEITEKIVSNLHNTSNLTSFSRPTISNINYTSYKKTSKKVYSEKVKDENNKAHYCVDDERIKQIYEELEKAINDATDGFDVKKTAVENAASSILSKQIGSGDNDYNEIQVWVELNNAINNGDDSPISQYKTAAKKMMSAYSKMVAMANCEYINDEGEIKKWYPTGETKYNDLKDAVDSRKKYLTEGKTGEDIYLQVVNKLESLSKDTSKIKSSGIYLSNGKTIDNTISQISSELKDTQTNINNAITILNEAINGKLLDKLDSLESLKKLVKEYNNKYQNLYDTAEESGTSLGNETIEELESNKSLCENITESGVDQLALRLKNIKNQLESISKAIDVMKYGSKKIKDIDDYSKAYGQVKNNIDSVPQKNGELKSKAESVFSGTFSPEQVFSLEHQGETDYDLNLENNTPELYAWMKTQFSGADDEKVKGKKNLLDKKNDEGDAQKENQKEDAEKTENVGEDIYGNSSYSGSDFPSGLDGENPYKLGEGVVNGVISFFKSILSGKFTNIRDSLYSTEYVMSMFSYRTYEYEGMYNLLKEKDETPKFKDFPGCFDSVRGSATQEGTWLSTAITDKYNQTLTNKMINKTNNVAFGAEVEYVLYGKKNKDNYRSAYFDIFDIRYLLNTVSGFVNFWSGTKNTTANAIELIANAISSATSGIVPAPLVKVVEILLLTALETVHDLKVLTSGFPLEIYKKDEANWTYSLSGNENDFSCGEKENESENSNGLFYSDYLYIFTYLGFENKKTASEMYYRVGDLIQANMRKLTSEGSYTLKKAQVYFKLDATIRVKPLMLDLPIASSYDNNPKNTTGWCTYSISETRGYS